MIKLGIIGTNWITAQFVAAACDSGYYELTAVYSRREETGKAFAEKNGLGAAIYTDLEQFFAATTFDTVYIASPNSLHGPQAIQAVNAGKHVIVEKPMVASLSELAALRVAVVAHPEVFIFEAARHLYEPNFAVVSDYTHRHQISGATLVYAKYSSKYDAYLAGENPNVFTTRFAGGALMDLGVYIVYCAVAWFGVPNSATYTPQLLGSGVDGSGVFHLDYGDFGVNLLCGKTTQSNLPSEIYSGRDVLELDAPESITSLQLVTPTGAEPVAVSAQDTNPMIREARFFATAINTRNFAARDAQFELAEQVHELIINARLQAGIKFPNDGIK